MEQSGYEEMAYMLPWIQLVGDLFGSFKELFPYKILPHAIDKFDGIDENCLILITNQGYVPPAIQYKYPLICQRHTRRGLKQ